MCNDELGLAEPIEKHIRGSQKVEGALSANHTCHKKSTPDGNNARWMEGRVGSTTGKDHKLFWPVFVWTMDKEAKKKLNDNTDCQWAEKIIHVLSAFGQSKKFQLRNTPTISGDLMRQEEIRLALPIFWRWATTSKRLKRPSRARRRRRFCKKNPSP
jgi:hypothetical protein